VEREIALLQNPPQLLGKPADQQYVKGHAVQSDVANDHAANAPDVVTHHLYQLWLIDCQGNFNTLEVR
jgi:hypothetical protein